MAFLVLLAVVLELLFKRLIKLARTGSVGERLSAERSLAPVSEDQRRPSHSLTGYANNMLSCLS